MLNAFITILLISIIIGLIAIIRGLYIRYNFLEADLIISQSKLSKSYANMESLANDLSLTRKKHREVLKQYEKELTYHDNLWATCKHIQSTAHRRYKIKPRVVRAIPIKLTSDWSKPTRT